MYDDTPQRRYRLRHREVEPEIVNAHMGNMGEESGGTLVETPLTVEDELEESGTIEEQEIRENCVHSYSPTSCRETIENSRRSKQRAS